MDSSNNQDQKTQVVPNPDQGNQGSVTDKIKAAIQPHSAHPGPAIPQDFNVTEEGTKEERRAKAQELNK
ncbi:hypothetical protein MCOR25_004412 [Pyricularia grisea]|uniref:Uncharacterized protein n=1 Tax=Pyricularia grisea TaxID=148305 RepID=A0A6P8AXF2_PYRGI|nr:hypothetical protein PgNI_10575 [Pyricularia grisea]KAI6369455.1 hypothetical protein MCOR25_004412 [Pyricularia grisea]TLD06974.1 hypothetical protein PgNI_10575 [Pyricularia grisea]